jgi:hypothetical protein
MLPDDPRGPLDPSGVRIGVPALTTRGMKEKEVKMVAGWIDAALRSGSDGIVLRQIRKEVKRLCKRFPVYKKNRRDIKNLKKMIKHISIKLPVLQKVGLKWQNQVLKKEVRNMKLISYS